MRALRLILPVLFAVGCGPGPAPQELKEVERAIVLSDLVGSSPTYSSGFVTLLHQNDDVVFPFFAGKDLATRMPKGEWVRFDRAGEGFTELAAPGALCRCKGGECPTEDPCVRTDTWAGTALIIQLGANDLFSIFFELYSSEALRADPQPAVDRFRANVKAVLALAADREPFPRPPLLLVTNVPDPSDGVGDVAALVQAAYPLPVSNLDVVTPELTLRVLGQLNAAIAEEAAARGGTLIDAHAHFMGHGYHATEATSPHYVAEDPTKWFRSFVDANRRGAHELRRLVWRHLAAEDVAQIPSDLPAELPQGLPAVPLKGWANRVVDANIARSIESPRLGTAPIANVSTDTSKIIGETDGAMGTVAIGILGNFITVDLGEGEEVTDGRGDDLVVIEMGRLLGGTPERYRVLLGDSPHGPFTAIADGAGEQAFDLAGSGVTAARYVRIESLVRLADIENGLGSPFYPGPELDAVGAVYPGSP